MLPSVFKQIFHQFINRTTHMEKVFILRLHHASVRKMPEEAHERLEKAEGVQGEDLASVLVEFLQGNGFGKFIESADPSCKRYSGECPLPHDFLALGHRACPDGLVKKRRFQASHEARKNSYMVTAAFVRLIRYGAHDSDGTTAGNYRPAGRRDAPHEFASSIKVLRVDLGTGGAEDDDLPLCHDTRRIAPQSKILR